MTVIEAVSTLFGAYFQSIDRLLAAFLTIEF